MKRLLACFLQNRSGATALEYGLIMLLMTAGIIVGIPLLGSGVQSALISVSAGLPSGGP